MGINAKCKTNEQKENDVIRPYALVIPHSGSYPFSIKNIVFESDKKLELG